MYTILESKHLFFLLYVRYERKIEERNKYPIMSMHDHDPSSSIDLLKGKKRRVDPKVKRHHFCFCNFNRLQYTGKA